MRNNYRRRFPLVYRSPQYRFLGLIIIYTSSIVAVLFFALFVPDILQMQDETLNPETRRIAAEKILTLHTRLWPVVIALICLVGLHSFVEFHRFIGPVYRFKKSFEAVADGDLCVRVKLRKKDFLVEEGTTFNLMVESVADKVSQVRMWGTKALETLGAEERQRLSQAVPETGPGGADRDALRRSLVNLVAAVEQFQLPEKIEPAGGQDRS